MPVLAILGAILVVLKVLGEIQLAWVWVLAPFWIGFAVVLVPFLIIAFLFLGALALDGLSLLFGRR